MLKIWSYSVFRDIRFVLPAKFKNCPLKNHFIYVWVCTHIYIIFPSIRTILFERLGLGIY